MGPIHRRQTLYFQVLILFLTSIVGMLSGGAAMAVDSVPSDITKIVQEASKKRNFSSELQQILKVEAKALTPLITIFEDSSRDWHERWFAAIALSKMHNTKARKTLIKGAGDQLAIIRAAVVQALGSVDEEDAMTTLRGTIDDPSLMVRTAAIKSVGKLKDRKAVDQLAGQLYNKKNYYRGEALFGIRESIITALGDIGSMNGVDPLMRVFQESDPKLHSLACASLEKIVREESKDASYPTIKAVKACPDYWLIWQKSHQKAQKN